MAKEIERAGILAVHICSIVPISKTVGANRIVPAVAIPHPLGDPAKSTEEEKALRRALVEKALGAMKTKVEDQRVFEG
jgi:betaine reductase